MFDLTLREKLLLAAALVVAIALGVWAAVIAANYIMNDPNDPLTKAGGLNPGGKDEAVTKQPLCTKVDLAWAQGAQN